MKRRGRTTGSIAALLLAVCCVAALGVAVPAGAQSVAVPQTDDQPAPDNTITRIDLAADGSATWEITLRTRLENDSDVAEYERFQGRFRSNTSRYLDPFSERMSGVVAAANDSSDREMRATDFAADTAIQEVPRRWGVVRFRFTWTGFAAVDGDAVVAGDVFAGGFFITDDDSLAVSVPDGYAVESVSPDPDEVGDGVVEWRGREDFDDGRPSVRAVPAARGGGDAGGDGAGGGADSGGVGNATLLAALALVFGAAGLAAYAVRTGRLGLGGEQTDHGRGSTATDRNDAVDDDGGAATTTEPGTGNESDAVDPELLTDEDRIRRTLRERDGRMKQSDVVEELGWSKSKTSRVLSRMAEEGDIEKLRIGRENVIDLAADPADED
ncbi:hypothetical protein EKH57_10210 [Halorubrum sp. BOL3-1]|uniref:helix-turn-helix transcriptional regulator n=1 Tax=Halorubrum sp. BOL3-1 TaxID=2497325 RepID=UPI001004D783|nr:helix-turn-helix domain-containing protein [Halorubrum sp. BOL3-1]QAU13063.1 hypothetical protein EKH57_10210 [Halorubrum sp. BOL3-1]